MRRAREIVAETGSLAAFFWRYEPGEGGPEAAAGLSRELKRRGWKFVGPTTVYAFMQAMGPVNDHAAACVVRKKALARRKAFIPPI